MAANYAKICQVPKFKAGFQQVPRLFQKFPEISVLS